MPCQRRVTVCLAPLHPSSKLILRLAAVHTQSKRFNTGKNYAGGQTHRAGYLGRAGENCAGWGIGRRPPLPPLSGRPRRRSPAAPISALQPLPPPPLPPLSGRPRRRSPAAPISALQPLPPPPPPLSRSPPPPPPSPQETEGIELRPRPLKKTASAGSSVATPGSSTPSPPTGSNGSLRPFPRPRTGHRAPGRLQQCRAMGEIDNGMPQIGKRFRNPDEAWLFWVAYGGRVGFDVRKRNKHVSKMDGQVTSCTFLCSNEGIRKKGITIDHEPKHVRAETRTNCKARMIISLDGVQRNYEVTDIVLEHNHCLQLPQTCHLMASQSKISELQAFEIEAAEDSGIMPQAAHEFACRQVGGPFNLGYTCRDQKNYLRTKDKQSQAGSMLKYVHDKMIENPSFQYALQLDCEKDIANIF
ncbi:uncharacterized protein [Aegilops tauschii subsp. strangulata]|uniref:uncharacterized protein n=1 Tax=Aegilops tauschii subsp. strangulata TaxID=200361 RepID=UPI003CC87C49